MAPVNRWKPILAVLAIFTTGVLTGLWSARWIDPPAPAPRSHFAGPGLAGLGMRRELLERMQRQLDLSPAQHAEIEALLKQSQERMRSAWEQAAPHAREESRRLRESIRALLTQEQRLKFEELISRPEKRFGNPRRLLDRSSRSPALPDAAHPVAPPPPSADPAR